MRSDQLFKNRRELKKKAHKVVRGHYFVLGFFTLLMILFGVEFSESLNVKKTDVNSGMTGILGSYLPMQLLGGSGIVSDILEGNLIDAKEQEEDNLAAEEKGDSDAQNVGKAEETAGQGSDKAEETAEQDAGKKEGTAAQDVKDPDTSALPGEETTEGNESKDAKQADSASDAAGGIVIAGLHFGRTNGVLAQIVTGLESGRFMVELAGMLRRLTGSNTGMKVALFLLLGGIYALYFIFLKNVYTAVLRRLFLVARVYEKVAPVDAAYFAKVKKWIRASLIMLRVSVQHALWCLTVVGGFIKYYSYFCVPFITAENPSVPAKEAIALSRRMMDGHKLELFKIMLTLTPWKLLSFLTFGISDMAYGASYRMACYSEYYAAIRSEALKKGLEGSAVLDDPYLFKKASRLELADVYFDVVDEITLLHEEKVEKLTGFRKLAADWFGVWLGSRKEKKKYDDKEGRAHAIFRLKESMEGMAYPDWLNPRWISRKLEKLGNYSPLRHYTVWTLFLLFILFAFFGWLWEVGLHFVQSGQLVNRGTFHGPWLPIYGSGGLIALLLCNRFRKNPVVEFFVSMVLCGCLEYYISWYLENTYHERWWSYDGYFLNLNGRICAEGLIVFGAGCCLVVYVAAPMFDYMLSKVPTKIVVGACIVLAALFTADAVYSSAHPNMAEGAIEAPAASARVFCLDPQVPKNQR